VCRPALAQNDPYLWLEDIHGQKAVEWVKAQNKRSLDNLEKRDLFRRCQPGRRTVYFSTTLDLTELRAAVKERVEKKSKLQKLRQQERETFTKPSGNQSGTNQEPLKKETGKTGDVACEVASMTAFARSLPVAANIPSRLSSPAETAKLT